MRPGTRSLGALLRPRPASLGHGQLTLSGPQLAIRLGAAPPGFFNSRSWGPRNAGGCVTRGACAARFPRPSADSQSGSGPVGMEEADAARPLGALGVGASAGVACSALTWPLKCKLSPIASLMG